MFDNRQPNTHKHYSTPTSVPRTQLLRKQTNTEPSTVLIVEKHWSTRKLFAQFPELYQPRFANVSCTWSWRICGITSAIHLSRNAMSLIRSTFWFPAGNNTERQSKAGEERRQFHLPILYHHLDNAGCVVIAWVRGGRFLLSGTQISRNSAVLFRRSSLSYAGRNRGLWSPNQNLTSQPTNQLRRSVPYSEVLAVSLLWRITLKTNISHPSQFMFMYLTFGLPSGILRSVFLYSVKEISGKHIGPIFKGQTAHE